MAVTATSANAAAIIYESFSQTPGDLAGKPGGTGLSGNWSASGNTVDIVNPPTLNYGDLENAGGQVNLPSSGSTWAAVSTTTALANAGLLNNGGTLWFSYVFQNTTSGGANEQSGFAFATERVNPGASGLNLVAAGDGFGVFVRGTAATASSWSNSTARAGGTGVTLQALGTPSLVIGRIVWGAGVGDNDTLTFWQRALDNIETEPTTGGGVKTAILNQSAFDTISFGQRNSGGLHYYDEIRFGASYSDVAPIPEPSAALFGGLGVLALLRRRR